jgi:sRNA-binding protein
MESGKLKEALLRFQRGEVPWEQVARLAELADEAQARLEARREAQREAQRRYRRTAAGKQRNLEQQQRRRVRRRQEQLATRVLRRCAVCSKLLPVTARLSRRTCSDRCRQKLSRRQGTHR